MLNSCPTLNPAVMTALVQASWSADQANVEAFAAQIAAMGGKDQPDALGLLLAVGLLALVGHLVLGGILGRLLVAGDGGDLLDLRVAAPTATKAPRVPRVPTAPVIFGTRYSPTRRRTR